MSKYTLPFASYASPFWMMVSMYATISGTYSLTRGMAVGRRTPAHATSLFSHLPCRTSYCVQLPHLPALPLNRQATFGILRQHQVRQRNSLSAISVSLTQVVHVAQEVGLVAAGVLLEHRVVGDVHVAARSVQRLRQHGTEGINQAIRSRLPFSACSEPAHVPHREVRFLLGASSTPVKLPRAQSQYAVLRALVAASQHLLATCAPAAAAAPGCA